MRKTIVTALIALTVMLALASCGDILTGQKQGRQLVTLSVNTGGTAGNSRSLTDDLARDKATYLEVIFKDGTDGTYYRAEGFLGSTVKVKIPVANYGSSNTDGNDAIILIGRRTDGTLLATGTIDPADANVTTATTSIRFNVTSLTADISAKVGSAFWIDESTGTDPASGNPLSPDPKPIASGDFNNKTALGFDDGDPWFQVPENTNSIGATLTISSLTGIATSTALKIPMTTGPVVTFKGINKITPAISVDPDTITFTSGSTLGTGVIRFEFDTTTEGSYIITFKIPVVGFDDTIDGIHTWYIRGGTDEGQPDFVGPTRPNPDTSMGAPANDPDFKGDPKEGVALKVAKTPKKLITVGITTPSYP